MLVSEFLLFENLKNTLDFLATVLVLNPYAANLLVNLDNRIVSVPAAYPYSLDSIASLEALLNGHELAVALLGNLHLACKSVVENLVASYVEQRTFLLLGAVIDYKISSGNPLAVLDYCE